MPVDPTLIDVPGEIFSERLSIRPPCLGEGAAIYEAIDESRNELCPWMPWEAKTLEPEDSEKVVRRAIARWLTREDLLLCIWDRNTGRYIGGSGLHRINWDVPAFSIGYWIRSSEVGKGYCTEAAKRIRDMAFQDLNANRVEIRADPENLRSVAVAKRAGFIFEGTLRCDSMSTSGEVRGTSIFALTREDFVKLKG